MKKLLSIVLVLAMCWSMTYTLIPVSDNVAEAVNTGSAALSGERYTVDWTIPEVGNVPVTNAGSSASGTETALSFLSYDILGYVSPKYSDTHKTNQEALGELTDGTVGSQHYLNDPWVGIYGNENNAIHIDLGGYHTNLSTVRLDMLSSPKEGIFLPSKITVAASADGITYNKVADSTGLNWTVNGASNSSAYYVPTEYDSVVYEVVVNPQLLFNAQHILIIFEHEDGSDGFDRCWTFVSEVEVRTAGAAVMPNFDNAAAWPLVDAPTGNVHDVNVGKGSVYQIIGTVGTGAAADNNRNELTNGIFDTTNTLGGAALVSVASIDGKFAVRLDLGDIQEDVTKISLAGFYDGTTAVAPASVAVYASNSDEVSAFGAVAFTSSVTTNGNRFEMNALSSGKAFDSRYITLIITPSSASSVVYLDEVMVYTTNEDISVENLAAEAQYKYVGENIGEADRYKDDKWQGSVNEKGVPVVDVYSKGDLNDGIKGTGTYLDPAWAGYNFAPSGGDVVEIVFDLGKEYKKINTVNFTTLEYTAGSSNSTSSVPANFTAYYSVVEDSFSSASSTVGVEKETFNVRTESDKLIVYHTYVAELSNVTARYIKIAIPKVLRELHLDEVEIWVGNKEEETTPNDPTSYVPVNYLPEKNETDYMMSAVWLSYVSLPALYRDGEYQVDEQTYRTRLSNYLTGMVNAGINTIMIHTRSHGDRYYGGPDTLFGQDKADASISPVSKYYTGSPLANPTYDALEIFIDEAHKLGLSVQSWVNPLRLQTQTIMDSYPNTYAIKQMLSGSYNGVTAGDMVGLVKSNYWLNIAYPEVRQYIVDSIMEPLYMYNFDGVVIDDYFYPEGMTSAFDSESANNIELKPDEDMGMGTWRRENTNALVKLLRTTLKSYKEDLIFGISPFGNNIALSDGYATSYHMNTMYADVRTWATTTFTANVNGSVQELTYMDYLSPQIYWGFTSTTGAEFGSVVDSGTNAGSYTWDSAVVDTETYYMLADDFEALYGNTALDYVNIDFSDWSDVKPSNNELRESGTYYMLQARPYRRTVTGSKTINGLIGEWSELTKDGLVKLVPSLGHYFNFESLNESRANEYSSMNVTFEQLKLMREHMTVDNVTGGSYVRKYYEIVLLRYVWDNDRGNFTRRDDVGYPANPAGYADIDAPAIEESTGGGGEVVNGRVYGQILYSSDTFYNDYTKPDGYRLNDYVTSARHLEIRNELLTYWQGNISMNAIQQ